MGKRKEALEANQHYVSSAFIGKPHFIVGCIESFTQITKKHIGFIVAHTNTKLRNTVKYLDGDKALPSSEFSELTLQEELELMDEYRAGKDSEDQEVITFTLRMAFRAMERYFYIHRQSIQVTTNQADNLAVLKKFIEEFDESLPFSYLIKLIRERFGINEEKALKLLHLYDPIDAEAELESLPDYTTPQISHVEKNDLRKNLDQSLNMLSSRRESIMRLRTGYLHTNYSPNDELTLKEVGKIHGILKERVRQIEADALIKLRMPHVSGNLKEFWPTRKDRT